MPSRPSACRRCVGADVTRATVACGPNITATPAAEHIAERGPGAAPGRSGRTPRTTSLSRSCAVPPRQGWPPLICVVHTCAVSPTARRMRADRRSADCTPSWGGSRAARREHQARRTHSATRRPSEEGSACRAPARGERSTRTTAEWRGEHTACDTVPAQSIERRPCPTEKEVGTRAHHELEKAHGTCVTERVYEVTRSVRHLQWREGRHPLSHGTPSPYTRSITAT